MFSYSNYYDYSLILRPKHLVNKLTKCVIKRVLDIYTCNLHELKYCQCKWHDSVPRDNASIEMEHDSQSQSGLQPHELELPTSPSGSSSKRDESPASSHRFFCPYENKSPARQSRSTTRGLRRPSSVSVSRDSRRNAENPQKHLATLYFQYWPVHEWKCATVTSRKK